MAEEQKAPVIVRRKKGGDHGHHGGSWKIAYADFMTAMMAFFLLMWLLGGTTQAQREGIAEYFRNPSAPQGPGGASSSMIDFGGALEIPRSEGEVFQGQEPALTPQELAADAALLEELLQELKVKIEQTAALRDFQDQLFLDITSEGLRIEIVDRRNRPMFDLGSTRLRWYTREILRELALTIEGVPNRISIAGHTDAVPYSAERTEYSNWELSADRANAARRELLSGGLGEDKLGRVVGLSSSVLLDKGDPFNPINRRITIVVLNKATERAIGLGPRPAARPPATPSRVEQVVEGALGPPAR